MERGHLLGHIRANLAGFQQIEGRQRFAPPRVRHQNRVHHGDLRVGSAVDLGHLIGRVHDLIGREGIAEAGIGRVDDGEDVARVAWAAYALFQGDNFLYGNLLYPSLPAMADEVVGMALELLNAPEAASGTITTGGTESIILAVKTARDQARAVRPMSGLPEIVAARTCHPAFNKAAEMLGLRVVRLPTGGDLRADPAAMAAAITPNTIMIVGSAPAYPIGGVDDVAALAALARAHGLWLHVDACVGGFFLPFARDLGEPVPDFDFSVPSVASISVDLHKYGYTSRGASPLLLRDGAVPGFHVRRLADRRVRHHDRRRLTAGRRRGVGLGGAELSRL